MLHHFAQQVIVIIFIFYSVVLMFLLSQVVAAVAGYATGNLHIPGGQKALIVSCKSQAKFEKKIPVKRTSTSKSPDFWGHNWSNLKIA